MKKCVDTCSRMSISSLKAAETTFKAFLIELKGAENGQAYSKKERDGNCP